MRSLLPIGVGVLLCGVFVALFCFFAAINGDRDWIRYDWAPGFSLADNSLESPTMNRGFTAIANGGTILVVGLAVAIGLGVVAARDPGRRRQSLLLLPVWAITLVGG